MVVNCGIIVYNINKNIYTLLENVLGFVEIFMIGVGLAADAFAVSVCRGLSMRRINYRHAVLIALTFGVFQALMPLIGWLLGQAFESYISFLSPWIAFVLLGAIGGKMIWDTLHEDEDCPCCEEKEERLDIKDLFLMAIATSIDALAVGVSFGVNGTPILSAMLIIGVTTFVICLLGVIIGNRFGAKYNKKAALAGGIILIAMGIKILVEGLFQ